eukprot:800816-Pelagomonas_calceolata.AAC.3
MQELTGVLRALRGEYVLPEAGGDLLRDGVGVLPTGGVHIVSMLLVKISISCSHEGRNIHALDPYRMPSPAAAARGSQAAQAILDSHTAANQGRLSNNLSHFQSPHRTKVGSPAAQAFLDSQTAANQGRPSSSPSYFGCPYIKVASSKGKLLAVKQARRLW